MVHSGGTLTHLRFLLRAPRPWQRLLGTLGAVRAAVILLAVLIAVLLLVCSSAEADPPGSTDTQRAQSNPNTTSLGVPWQPIGPLRVVTSAYGNVTGRISSIAVDPADSTGNTVYIGVTGGGVWQSTNAAGPVAAVVFTPLTDALGGVLTSSPVSLSIGALTVQAGDTGVVLAGTGDPNDSSDSYWGAGVLRSVDRGQTWRLITQSNDGFHSASYNRHFKGEAFGGFAWSGVSLNTVVAAVSESSEGLIVNAEDGNSQAGIYYSVDAGATWLLASVQDGPNSIVQAPGFVGGSAAGATSIVWNPVRRRFYAAIRFHGYYESTDGIQWTRLINQPGTGLLPSTCPAIYSSVACPIFRGAIAVQPNSGDLFALTTDINNIDQGLWQDACSAASGVCASPTVNFQLLPSQALADGNKVIEQADYDLWIAAIPVSNDTILYAGTEDIFRCSLSAGCNWRNTTNVNTCVAAQVATSQHAVEASLAGSLTSPLPGLMYFGNDGGLWRSTDGVQQAAPPCSADDATHFQNLNVGIGSLAEVKDLATDPTNPAIFMTALGALGTSASTPSNAVPVQVLDGEGSHVAIDPVNPVNWFAASAGGVSIHSCTQGEACTISGFGPTIIGSAQVGGDGDALEFPAPWILDPQDTTRIIVGTCRVWRGPTSGGANWSTANDLSPFLDGTEPSTSDPVCTSNGVVRSLAASGTVSNLNGNQEIIYAGMAGVFDGGSTAAGRIYSAAVSSTSGALTHWTDLSTSPVINDIFANRGQFNPGRFAISSIAVDPHDTTGQTIYVTIDGFSGDGISEPFFYASTNGGASWLNLSSNLPSSPANTVLVDPNDANTVYVGLDIGAYVTQQIASCSGSGVNCWSLLGTGLPTSPVIKLTLAGSQSGGLLQAATYGRGVWQTGLLASVATTATLTPAALGFSGEALSTPSPPQSLTVTNTGAAPLAISLVAVTGDFAETDDCNGSVAVGSSCTVQVTFTPSVAGTRTGTVKVFANIPSGQLSATLSGTGLAGGTMEALPATLAFSATGVGTVSATQNVTISNVGALTVAMTSETVSGDYKITANTCGPTLASQFGCTVGVAFAPTAPGSRAGTLTFVDDVGTQTVPLTGTGISAATDALSPLVLTFSAQLVNTSSAPQAVTLTNSGDASLTTISVTVSGAFTLSNGCGNTLIGHASCAISVTYVPSRAGSASGTLTVTDAIHTQTVALTGTGMPAAVDVVAPLALTFAGQVLNTTSSPQTVTLTDSSNAALTLISAQVTGDFVLSSGCAATLQGHSSCTFSVSYLPTQAGAEAGSLAVTDANGTQSVSLSGTGLSSSTLAASPGSLAFGAVNLTTASAPQTITFTSEITATMTGLSFAVNGADYAIASDTCPASLPGGAACALQIIFTPSVVGARSGTLTANSSTLPAPLAIPLTGTGQLQATDSLSPSTLDFGSVPVNTASIVRHITMTNSGDASVTGITPTTAGSFVLESGCGTILPGHSSCTFALEFLPTIAGPNTGSLTIVDSVETQVAPLTGTGLAPSTDTLKPTLISFGNQLLNTPSTPQVVTLLNSGGVTLTGITVALTGDFTMINGCAGTLAANTTCIITVTYLPTVAGAETGALTVIDALRTQTVTLNGTGVVAPTDALTPASLTFFPQALNTSSAPQPVTLTNSGGTMLTGIAASISGDFTLASGCGATLAAGSSCVLNVSFLPTHTGVESGTLTVVDALRTQTVALNGPIQAPATDTLAPLSLAFGSEPMGVPSSSQTVTLTNSGQASLTGIKTKIDGDFSLTTTCTSTLNGSSSCAINVVYTPTHTGAATGTLTVTDDIQVQKVALSGTGSSGSTTSTFSVQVDGAATATVPSGSSAGYAVDVVPTTAASGTASMSCSGLPDYTTCAFSPASVALVPGSTVKVSVALATGTGISLSALPGHGQGTAITTLLAVVLPFGLLRGRRRSTALLALLCVLAVGVLSGCGGVSVSTGGGGGPVVTPPGTYQITITGSAASESHTTTVTLVVQ